MSIWRRMKGMMQRSSVVLLLAGGFDPGGLWWAVMNRHHCLYYIPRGVCPKTPDSSTQIPLKWIIKALERLLSGECLPRGFCSLGRACHQRRNEQYVVFHGTVPPVLPHAWSSRCCPLPPLLHGSWAKKHLCAAGMEGTYRSCSCLSLDISSVIPGWQLYTHAWSPSLSHLELVLGFCPYCKHTEGFTVFVRGQISLVLGWEAWWVSQDL